MNDWLAVLLGLLLLAIASELLVRGSVHIALTLGVSQMVVGATLVAFGTSSPEMMVSTVAAWRGQGDIAVGNVLGSNTFNLGVILGVSALCRPILGVAAAARFEMRYLVATVLLAFTPWLLGDRITRPFGAGLLAIVIVFMGLSIHRERRRARADHAPAVQRARGRMLLSCGMVVAGLVGLPFGADYLVQGAIGIAKSAGLSEAFIGLTIIAAGTSLPELATSVNAALKGHPEIALGNVLGSNIFNLGAVLGVAALIQPLAIDWAVDGPSLLLGAFYALWTAGQLRFFGSMGRVSGALFLGSYCVYLGYLVRTQAA